MIGIQTDNCNEMVKQDKSTIYVLGSNNKLLHLQQGEKDDKTFECIGVYDFTGYDLLPSPWSTCHLDKGAITIDENVYQANSTNDLQQSGEG